MEIINCIVIKKLLKAAKNIRIVLVLSANSILDTSGRGKMVQDTLATLNSIFKNTDYSEHIDSIFPLVTRYNSDATLSQIKGQFCECFKDESELSNVFKEIADKIELVDPLERKLVTDEISLSQFFNRLKNNQPMSGKDLDGPWSNEILIKSI